MVRTQYVSSEGMSLAYQVLSEEGPTFVQVPGAISNLALEDATPEGAEYYERLARICRVIRFDKRGTGLSDRGATTITIDQQLADIEAIFQATGTERAVVCGLSHGGALAVLYTVAYPERVERLILIDGICCDSQDPFRPMTGENAFISDVVLQNIQTDFEQFIGWFARSAFPSMGPEELDAATAFMRATASPAAYLSIFRGLRGMDLRPMLRRIEVPTLVIHAAEDALVPAAHGRYFAEHIANAQYLEPATDSHVPWFDPAVRDQVVDAVDAFVSGGTVHAADPVVVSVLFTDIVDSTAQQQRLGNDAWQAVRQRFERGTAAAVERAHGRVVDFTGDGVMAAFTTPGQALRAAQALVAAARELGIEIRAGVHAGEALQHGNALSGLCVNVAARVSAAAGPGEILTTQVVQGLVEGSGFHFADRGEVDLKGIGARRLLRLT